MWAAGEPLMAATIRQRAEVSRILNSSEVLCKALFRLELDRYLCFKRRLAPRQFPA